MKRETIEVSECADVLVETTCHELQNADGTSQVFREVVELIPGRLWIGPLGDDLGRALMDACESAGRNFHPTRQFGVRYALVRTLDADELERNALGWDTDQLIQTAVALSRWIRPTSWGFQYAARVRFDGPKDGFQIIPCSMTNLCSSGFVEHDLRWDRLTPSDASDLRNLLQRYLQGVGSLSERVSTVAWNHEYIRRTYFLDVGWYLVGASFEALVHTARDGASKQFAERVASLGAAVGEAVMTEQRAKTIYGDIRSALAHGGHVMDLDHAPHLESFSLAMNVLRKVLRRCVEDPSFAANFKDDAPIKAWHPVTITRKGKPVIV